MGVEPDRPQMTEDSTSEGALREAEVRLHQALADLENQRKRFDRDLSLGRRRDREAALREWLNVVDSLQKAGECDGASLEDLLVGVRATHRQALDVLEHLEVRRMKTVGEPFDPRLHEAISEAPGAPKGAAVNEFAKKSFAGEDVREGILAGVAIKLQDPVFESQTKNKLGSTDVRSWIVPEVKRQVVLWLHKNPEDAEALNPRKGTIGGQ